MSETRAILQLMLTPGLGNKTLTTLLARVANDRQSAESIADAPPVDLVRQYRLRPEVALAVAMQKDQAAALADELERYDIQLLAIGGKYYPQHLQETLGKDAPPLLFARGNVAILDKPAVAFAGSRHASSAGLAATRVVASTLGAAGINIVSGYANGVDLAAHTAALMTNNGVTTLILAEGIRHFRAKEEIAELLSPENHVILSEFPPTLRWIARNAMQRNKTIIGLSSALLIVESGEDGGTFAAGEEALKRHSPVFVLRYVQPASMPTGNETLIRLGANPIAVDGDGDVNVGEIQNCATSNSHRTPPSKHQQGKLL